MPESYTIASCRTIKFGNDCKFQIIGISLEAVCVCYFSQGRIQNFGKGGSEKHIHNWGAGMGGGVPPPVTARGSGASPQPLFCFCVYLA